jgi:restriction system protein
LISYGGAKPPGKRIATPIPSIQSLLLPVLRIVADGSGHTVEEIRNRVKAEFKLTDKQIQQTHPKSGTNILVNRVAWALAHLVMGKAVAPERAGFYRMTERGVAILKANPLELTIKELH